MQHLAKHGCVVTDKTKPRFVRSFMPPLMSLWSAIIAAGLFALPSAAAGTQTADAWSLAQDLPRDASIQLTRRDCPPRGGDQEIVVCGRREDSSRYRVPPSENGFDPEGPMESVSRERNRWLEGRDIGIGSCSTVGPGGWTGCFARAVSKAQQQRAGR